MSNPFKAGDHVAIAGKNVKTDPDAVGRIDKVEGEFVFISNGNMPYLGTYSGKKFHYKEIVQPKP